MAAPPRRCSRPTPTLRARDVCSQRSGRTRKDLNAKTAALRAGVHGGVSILGAARALLGPGCVLSSIPCLLLPLSHVKTACLWRYFCFKMHILLQAVPSCFPAFRFVVQRADACPQQQNTSPWFYFGLFCRNLPVGSHSGAVWPRRTNESSSSSSLLPTYHTCYVGVCGVEYGACVHGAAVLLCRSSLLCFLFCLSLFIALSCLFMNWRH